MRDLVVAIGTAVLVLFLSTPGLVAQAQFGTEQEARAMLKSSCRVEREQGDGTLTAHPHLKGEHLQDIVGKKGYPLGKVIMETATEGKIDQVTYWWPRPGSDKPLEKHSFYTKVADQNCGVGYYQG